jgi:hypothetical protein
MVNTTQHESEVDMCGSFVRNLGATLGLAVCGTVLYAASCVKNEQSLTEWL